MERGRERRVDIEMLKNGLTGMAILLAFVGSAPAQAAPDDSFAWLRHARVFLLDAYTYPLFPSIEFDAERLAETMREMHADTLRVATSGHYFLIPKTPFSTAPGLGNRDILAECIKACKPRGIRVVPYVRAGGSVTAEIVKPEWAYRADPQGAIPVTWDLGCRMSVLCWNTPYRQAFYELVEKIAAYDIDAIYFDAWKLCYGFEEKVCYCDGCRRGFRDACGLELPYRENPSQYSASERETIARYHAWYRGQMVDVSREVKRLIRARKNIPLIFNLNHVSKIRDTSFTDPRIVEESDAFLYEMSDTMLERAEGISLAVAHGLAVWPYVDIYHGYPRINIFGEGHAQNIYATVAFGGSPVLYHTYFFVDHPAARRGVSDAFGVFARNRRYVEGFQPEPFCAVVWNDRDPPGHAAKGWLWNRDARLCTSGAFAACLDGRVQATSFLQEDLSRPELLKKYSVLYLADVCCLSDAQLAGIRRFVADGGGLVLTGATSLYDERGRRRDFALGTMAGIESLAPDETLRDRIAASQTFGGTWDLYLKARPDQRVLRSPLADGLMPAFTFEPVRALPQASVAAELVHGSDPRPLGPGLVVTRYGEGKVAYIAAALDAAYLQSNIPQMAEFLREVIVYVSPSGLPYEVDSPGSVMANMTAQGNIRVLHLVNWTGCKPERPRQNTYYVPPLEKVVVRYPIPGGKRLKQVQLFVPTEFTQSLKGNLLTVTLPRLEKYQGVVVELSDVE